MGRGEAGTVLRRSDWTPSWIGVPSNANGCDSGGQDADLPARRLWLVSWSRSRCRRRSTTSSYRSWRRRSRSRAEVARVGVPLIGALVVSLIVTAVVLATCDGAARYRSPIVAATVAIGGLILALAYRDEFRLADSPATSPALGAVFAGAVVAAELLRRSSGTRLAWLGSALLAGTTTGLLVYVSVALDGAVPATDICASAASARSL